MRDGTAQPQGPQKENTFILGNCTGVNSLVREVDVCRYSKRVRSAQVNWRSTDRVDRYEVGCLQEAV